MQKRRGALFTLKCQNERQVTLDLPYYFVRNNGKGKMRTKGMLPLTVTTGLMKSQDFSSCFCVGVCTCVTVWCPCLRLSQASFFLSTSVHVCHSIRMNSTMNSVTHTREVVSKNCAKPSKRHEYRVRKSIAAVVRLIFLVNEFPSKGNI